MAGTPTPQSSPTPCSNAAPVWCPGLRRSWPGGRVADLRDGGRRAEDPLFGRAFSVPPFEVDRLSSLEVGGLAPVGGGRLPSCQVGGPASLGRLAVRVAGPGGGGRLCHPGGIPLVGRTPAGRPATLGSRVRGRHCSPFCGSHRWGFRRATMGGTGGHHSRLSPGCRDGGCPHRPSGPRRPTDGIDGPAVRRQRAGCGPGQRTFHRRRAIEDRRAEPGDGAAVRFRRETGRLGLTSRDRARRSAGGWLRDRRRTVSTPGPHRYGRWVGQCPPDADPPADGVSSPRPGRPTATLSWRVVNGARTRIPTSPASAT